MIEPRFHSVMPFHEGLAQVEQDGKRGFIDKGGAFVIPPKFGDWFPSPSGKSTDLLRIDDTFSDGLVRVERDTKYPTPVVEDGKTNPQPISEVPQKRLIGFMDREGKLAIEPRFEMAGHFKDGVSLVEETRFEGGGFDRRQLNLPTNDN